MKRSFKTWFIGFGLMTSLYACVDHQLGGPSSPIRLRLKTVQGISLHTTYTYNSQNRLSTITKADGSLGVYTYDYSPGFAQLNQYPNPADQSTGSATSFPYNVSDSTTFHASTYSIRNSVVDYSIRNKGVYFSLNSSKHLTGVYTQYGTGQALDVSFTTYTNTGENITQGGFANGRSRLRDDVYEYDDKINPFYGSTDPDISDIQRFSRNNVTKITSTYPVVLPVQTTVYTYEYNQQGLPTKRTTQGSAEVVNYTYESY